MDVLLELAYALGAEGVGDRFTFAGVLCSIAGVEETSSDRDEGIVVFSIVRAGELL